jgi:hypothetical protein
MNRIVDNEKGRRAPLFFLRYVNVTLLFITVLAFSCWLAQAQPSQRDTWVVFAPAKGDPLRAPLLQGEAAHARLRVLGAIPKQEHFRGGPWGELRLAFSKALREDDRVFANAGILVGFLRENIDFF